MSRRQLAAAYVGEGPSDREVMKRLAQRILSRPGDPELVAVPGKQPTLRSGGCGEVMKVLPVFVRWAHAHDVDALFVHVDQDDLPRFMLRDSEQANTAPNRIKRVFQEHRQDEQRTQLIIASPFVHMESWLLAAFDEARGEVDLEHELRAWPNRGAALRRKQKMAFSRLARLEFGKDESEFSLRALAAEQLGVELEKLDRLFPDSFGEFRLGVERLRGE